MKQKLNIFKLGFFCLVLVPLFGETEETGRLLLIKCETHSAVGFLSVPESCPYERTEQLEDDGVDYGTSKVIHKITSFTNATNEVFGIGRNFSKAWLDAYNVCKEENCDLKSCEVIGKKLSSFDIFFAMNCNCGIKTEKSSCEQVGVAKTMLHSIKDPNWEALLKKAKTSCSKNSFLYGCFFYSTGKIIKNI